MSGVYRRDGLPAATQAYQARQRAEWAKFPTLQRFLQDHYPLEWQAIQRCGKKFAYSEDRDRPGFFKFRPLGCWRQPFCIICSRTKINVRVRDTLNKFNECTPRGAQPRFIHIVQTSPLTDEGEGWGLAASKDKGGFAKIVWQTIEERIGEGLGGVLTYQDFGERAFKKRHPHIDLTLNGWQVLDGKATHAPPIELRNGGYAKWQQALQIRAVTFSIDARPGNLYVSPVITGHKEYYKVLRYQQRELVDLRKIDYSRDKQLVYWISYKDNTRTKHTVHEFMAGLFEYQLRLGPWCQDWGEGRQILNFRYGHMADRILPKTRALVGGTEIPHKCNCPCNDCGDWDRVFLDEVDDALAGNQWTQDYLSKPTPRGSVPKVGRTPDF